MPTPPPDVETYLAAQPDEVRAVLTQIRRVLHEAVPGAQDAISYAIPALALDGRALVHYAGWKAHVSVYPVPDADAELAARIAPFLAGKGTLKFPLSQPVPYDLIARVGGLLAQQRGPQRPRKSNGE